MKDHAQMFKDRFTCPHCSSVPESKFSGHCAVCGRRPSMFLQAFGIHELTEKDEDDFTIHTLKLQLSELKEKLAYNEKGIAEWREIAQGHEANYKYMANRAAEQQREIEQLKANQGKPQDPVFWYRPLRDGLYEGPVHNDSVGGKMLRDEKPGEWIALYAHHQAAMVVSE